MRFLIQDSREKRFQICLNDETKQNMKIESKIICC